MPELSQNLVFIGGGHSHAIALNLWGKQPLADVNVTLISNVRHTPYSGMLPGYIAGFYCFEEVHIDLEPLAKFARSRFVLDRAVGLDLDNRRVICGDRPPIPFDVVSIDIGSTPATIATPGAADYAIPAKPVPQLLHHWSELLDRVQAEPNRRWRLAVVGGGAGGVELILSMQARLWRLLPPGDRAALEFHLFQRGCELLPSHNPYVRTTLTRLLGDRGIHLHLGETVSGLTREGGAIALQCASGFCVACDRVFWVTQASAPEWIARSGLATDAAGFILVGDTLQSLSHPEVFATGDIATMQNHPRPKAGVFAVRQGPPLDRNLRLFLQNRPPQPFRPQTQFLTLIGTGTGRAIASRGAFGCGPNRLLWRWKDRIDRKFMQTFR
ncbi:FAD-dependent oxidoreductase [Oxynema aestuarii]|uniref:FAD-dependent oxidoreductase n=1 Tax=Oxynema aestuarii AP17 TaxID=2064643 RepID=A0A6H1U324_9CYAN|nr:FAD-dependent oxidoreductase [Oxynema aestuarii]QIZ72433.1 FAD-dependent oxidoreductase [Oxynema aestuarii AP17]